MYLPVLLHSSGSPPSTQQPNMKQTEMRSTTSDRHGCGLGRASSLAYPHAVYLGSESFRTDTTMISLPSHIV
jgi:hypothetical protein